MTEELYYVEIVEIDTDRVEKRMGPFPERKAEKVSRGAEINMSDEFITYVVPASDVDEA